jgi:hypothetical protein
MKFDAYGATIRGDQGLADVARSISEPLDWFIGKGKPMRRYGELLEIHAGNRMAAWIGQEAATGNIYIEGKGDTTPALVKALRDHFPMHTAARLDVAEDYDEQGAFDALQGLIRSHKGPRVKGEYVRLPDDDQDGKTWAAGVRGGVGYLRLYEKGKQPENVCHGRPNWIRAELECRPHYARDKAAAAKMSPLQVWGMSAWTQRVGEVLTQCPISRFEPEVREYSHGKTMRYVFNNYRRMFQEMLDNGEHVESTMRAIWEEEDSYMHKRKKH